MPSMNARVGSAQGERASAARRILSAARSLAARGGVSEISIGAVAHEAGVSKALIHYHFRDKSSLLRALVEDVRSRIADRADITIPSTRDAHVLDAFWSWVQRELQQDDIRILISLSESDDEEVRTVVRQVFGERRRAAVHHATLIFSHLGLKPRLPEELVADALLAFIDGLVVRQALEPDRDPRPAFDVLWLALLTLAD